MLVALTLAFVHFGETSSEMRAIITTILPPTGYTLHFGTNQAFALPTISPDGKKIVFGAVSKDGKSQLWLRSLDSATAHPLIGSEGAVSPFWSPDSRYVGFGSVDNKLKKIDIQGGPPVTLTDLTAPLRGASWSLEGVILFWAERKRPDPTDFGRGRKGKFGYNARMVLLWKLDRWGRSVADCVLNIQEPGVSAIEQDRKVRRGVLRLDAMDRDVTLRIVVESPPKGVDFSLQKGRGSAYNTVQNQRSQGNDLTFEFTVSVKVTSRRATPAFSGPFVQGPAAGRFVYLDIGTHAGQADSCWSRRLKIPLVGITEEMIQGGAVLEARIPGTGKDGGPSCATVKSFGGWKTPRDANKA